jgi:hypothetical protein
LHVSILKGFYWYSQQQKMAKNGTPSQRFRDELWKILILIKFDERNRTTITYLEMILLKHFKFIKFILIYSHQVDTTCISHQFSWILIKKEKNKNENFSYAWLKYSIMEKRVRN